MAYDVRLGRATVGHRLALFQATSYVSGEADQQQAAGGTQSVHLSHANRLFDIGDLRYEFGPAGGAWCRWSDRYDEVGPGDAGDTRHLTAPSSISGTEGAGINAVLAAVARF